MRDVRLPGMLLMVTALLAMGAKGGSCGEDPAAEDPAPAGPATPEAATEAPVEDAPAVQGAWTSPSCGERTYPREVTLLDGGRYTILDLISPCPPDAQCIWSGIVRYKGLWTLEGDEIRLEQKTEGTSPVPAPEPPAVMHFRDGVLSEPGPEGGVCAYARK